MLLRFSPLFSEDGPAAVEPVAPGVFSGAGWSLSVEGGVLNIVITTLPVSGGAPITDIEYRRDAGPEISLGASAPGTFPSTAELGEDVQIRAVNSVGQGPWSAVKTIAPVAPGVIASDALSGRTLTVTVTSATGTPAPALSIAMTANGDVVSPTLVSPGVWVYTMPSSASATLLEWTVAAANGVSPNATASGSETVPADVVLQITSVSIAAQQPTGMVPVTLAGDNGTYPWIITTTDPSVTPPSRAQVVAGQDHTGSAAAGAGTVAFAGVNVDVSIPAGPTADYYLVIADGDSILWDGPVTIDRTAPVLSSPTGTQTGQTTASWGVTSDSAGGTIYAGVRPTASAALTAAQLIAGSGGAGVDFDSDATPTADSANGGSFTGLTAATAYRVDIVHVDAFGNRSAVSTSAEFTTASASVDATVAATGAVTGATTTRTLSAVDLGAAVSDREFLVFWAGRFNIAFNAAEWQASVAGQTSVSPVINQSPTSQNNHILVWRISVPSGTSGDIVLARLSGSNDLRGGVFGAIRVTGSPTLGTPVIVSDSDLGTVNGAESPAYTLNSSITIGADGSALLALTGMTRFGTDVTWTGVTEILSSGSGAGGGSVAFDAGVTSGVKNLTTAYAGMNAFDRAVVVTVEIAA